METTETAVKDNLYVADKVVDKKRSLFNLQSIAIALTASVVYLIASYFVLGYKADQLVLVVIFNSLFFVSRPTRAFIIGFSIFIIYWIIFDYMKAFPNYLYNDVHIESLYNTEKDLFGFNWNNIIVTPNEYFALNPSRTLDIITGIFYLCWVPVPLAFAGVIFFRNRSYFFQFALTFFIVNLIGFIGYYVYPAAPPWYVAQYGFDFIASTRGNTAGLSRFDDLIGTKVYAGIYAKSSNVFAAMPSMHAAFMLIVTYYGIRMQLGVWNIFFAMVTLGIWFGAIYSGHHYILDIVAGIASAILAIIILQYLIRTKPGSRALNKLIRVTTWRV